MASARYEITVEKYNSPATEFWVNVYHVMAEEGSNFGPVMEQLVNAEKALYHSSTIITKVRVRGDAPGNLGVTYVQNVQGSFSGTNDLMPLWVVARVDFTVPGSRPSRKYLRGALFEADVTFTTLTDSAKAVLNAYGNAILAIPGICDVDGQAITGMSVYPAPAMRQLRRGRKKKITQ